VIARGWVRALPILVALAAGAPDHARGQAPDAGTDPAVEPFLLDDDRAQERRRLVEEFIAPEVRDVAVLQAMLDVPRHKFVPEEYARSAYANRPLPIGLGQTISQPSLVARMTALLELTGESRVLEIGTGSGYQTAVLAELAGEVYSIELLEELGTRAADTLQRLGYGNIHLRIGDGYAGWPEAAPFDAIVVTCAPETIPAPLQEQLAEGGHLVIPVGERGNQELLVVRRENGVLTTRRDIAVRFVPMVDAEGTTHAA